MLTFEHAREKLMPRLSKLLVCLPLTSPMCWVLKGLWSRAGVGNPQPAGWTQPMIHMTHKTQVIAAFWQLGNLVTFQQQQGESVAARSEVPACLGLRCVISSCHSEKMGDPWSRV